MSKETVELVEPNIVVFADMLQKAILDGWKISEQYPANYFGGVYVVTMERGEEDTKVSETEETDNKVSEETPAKRGPKPKVVK